MIRHTTHLLISYHAKSFSTTNVASEVCDKNSKSLKTFTKAVFHSFLWVDVVKVFISCCVNLSGSIPAAFHLNDIVYQEPFRILKVRNSQNKIKFQDWWGFFAAASFSFPFALICFLLFIETLSYSRRDCKNSRKPQKIESKEFCFEFFSFHPKFRFCREKSFLSSINENINQREISNHFVGRFISFSVESARKFPARQMRGSSREHLW